MAESESRFGCLATVLYSHRTRCGHPHSSARSTGAFRRQSLVGGQESTGRARPRGRHRHDAPDAQGCWLARADRGCRTTPCLSMMSLSAVVWVAWPGDFVWLRHFRSRMYSSSSHRAAFRDGATLRRALAEPLDPFTERPATSCEHIRTVADASF